MVSKGLGELKDKSHDILLKNRRITDECQYTVPSPETYPYQWLWDSCFHAIVLAHFSPKDAKKELRALVTKQFGNGLIPHIIYWERKEGVVDFPWGTNDTSSITQPPMLAYAAWQIFLKDGDKKFLEEMYKPLYHYYNYLLRERDPRNNHLAGIINPDESGEDDSPRFDVPLGIGADQTPEESLNKRKALIEKNKTCNFDAPFCMKHFFWVKDVPFNAILVKNLSMLGMIAKEIGRMDESFYFREEELRVADAMRDRMREDNIFWSLCGENYKKLFVKTWAMFAPLFGKVVDHNEAELLVTQHLRDTHQFATPFCLPTVAKEEKTYDPNGFWRGPVWAATNWFVYHGLVDYGFAEDAERVRESLARLLRRSGFRERFNPETGAGIGARDFTWGALVIDLFARNPDDSTERTIHSKSTE